MTQAIDEPAVKVKGSKALAARLGGGQKEASSTGTATGAQQSQVDEALIAALEAEEAKSAEETKSNDKLAPYDIQIQSGLHAGAQISLAEGVYRIGDDVSADIFLLDLEGQTAQIQFNNGQVMVSGQDRAPVDLPHTVTLGGASLRISGGPSPVKPTETQEEEQELQTITPDTRKTLSTNKKPFIKILMIAVLIIAAISLAGFFLLMPSSPKFSGQIPDTALQNTTLQNNSPTQQGLAVMSGEMRHWLKQNAPTLIPQRTGLAGYTLVGHLSEARLKAIQAAYVQAFPGSTLPDKDITTPKRIEQALRQRLIESDTRTAITLSWQKATAENDSLPTLLATGSLPSDQFRFWQDVQKWFTARYAQHITLVDQVTATGASIEAPPRIALEAVWIGENPYIITADGRRTRPGEKLPNGWQVVSITAKEVRLAQGERIEAISLPQAESTTALSTLSKPKTVATQKPLEPEASKQPLFKMGMKESTE